jgi:DNA-binding CsgD family transcriptional regulator
VTRPFEVARSSRDPAIDAWLACRNLTDAGFICLSRNMRSADFLELHFAEGPTGAWEAACEWGATAFARTYNIRRPGLVTEALARNSDRTTVHDSEDGPILAPENAAGLTRSEWRVCVLVSRGLTAKAAADEIGVTVNTIRTHLRNIYVKTNLGSYYQLARRLVSPMEQQALNQGWHELSA